MRFGGLIALVGALLVAGTNISEAASTASITLVWTTPGDDDMVGNPTAYDLRYSEQPINTANFSAALRVGFVPKPGQAGALQTCSVNGLVPGKAYYFALKTVDDRGNWSPISNVVFYDGSSVSIASEIEQVSFSSPWPNPATNQANFSYSLTRRCGVRVDCYDTQGRRVRTLVDDERDAGRHELEWDLTDASGHRLGGGVYFVVAQAEGQSFKKRVVVTR